LRWAAAGSSKLKIVKITKLRELYKGALGRAAAGSLVDSRLSEPQLQGREIHQSCKTE
jgi:hypothetical protein